jgi:hypothetical protein
LIVRRALLAIAIGAGCAVAPPAIHVTVTPSALAKLNAIGPADALLAGAGDIAQCGRQLDAARATAALLDELPNATIFTAGDNAYPHGTAHDFAACYDPTWGRFRARTFPSPGNHDGNDYFAYFANAHGRWYSYDRGAWHIVSLDSDAPFGARSPQGEWLERDLAANRKPCVAAYWHHPLFSSALHGWQPGDRGHRVGPIWATLLRHHADVVINGHDHDYERFAPQRADGTRDANGLREFVAGTGGAKQRGFVLPRPNSERRFNAYGVLVLTLHAGSYEWHFVGIDGKILDESAAPQPCHPKT